MSRAYRFLLRLPPKLMERVKRLADEQWKSINLIIREAIEAYLEDK